MIDFLVLLIAILYIWLFYELVTAPVGYENETGFHYGSETTKATATGDGESEAVNPAHN